MSLPPSLNIAVDRIIEQFQPLRVILFGSWARGDATSDSDVDLLVVMPEGTEKRAAAIEIRRNLRDMPFAKDIVVTTESEIGKRGNLAGTVLQPALHEGKVLFERE